MSSSGPFTLKEPPNYATVQGDQRKLTQYIAALKLWAKVGGVEKKNQADCIKYNAFQFSPDYFDELNARFGESLSENEDGVNHIIAFLEEKFGVNQHTEIVRKLNVFYSCSRSKNEDLVKYTSRFEQAYTECTKIKVAGSKAIINYSSTALAVLLLHTANLSDVDHRSLLAVSTLTRPPKQRKRKHSSVQKLLLLLTRSQSLPITRLSRVSAHPEIPTTWPRSLHRSWS